MTGQQGNVRVAVIGLTLVMVAALFAACGSSSPSGVASLGSSTSTTVAGGIAGSSGGPPTAAELDLQAKFVSCMRRHGVPDMPDPLSTGGFSRSALNAAAEIPTSQSVLGSDIDKLASPQFKRALKACYSVAVAAGFVHAPAQIAAQNAQHVAQMLKISECMRANGVPNFPDPNSQGQPIVSQSITNNPAYSAAATKCGAPPS